jgi:hypothetical protein
LLLTQRNPPLPPGHAQRYPLSSLMPDLCPYPPCKCLVPTGELFCGEICAMLGAGLVNQVATSSAVPLKPDQEVVPRCACGHPGCGDSQVSGDVH